MYWSYALVSVLIVSAISFVGVLSLSLRERWLRRVLLLLVGFATGGLIGDAFIHLLPQAYEQLGIKLTTSLYVIAGMLIFFVLEKFIRWQHIHHLPQGVPHRHHIGVMNLVGDGVHNLIDGILIGSTYLVSIPLGISTTLAVVLHEIPQEFGDFGILLHSGYSRRQVLLFNFFSALVAVAGTLIVLVFGPSIADFATVMVPITAGGFLYIAGSDLIPELHQEVKPVHSLGQFGALVLGIAVMALLLYLE